MKLRLLAVILLASYFGSSTLSAKDHPDFSGTWKLDAAKSDFGPLPQPTKFERKIEHKDPKLTITTSQANAQGEDTSTVHYSTDGVETSNTIRGIPAKTVTKWDGDILVNDSKLELGNGGEIAVHERWVMAADGKSYNVNSHLETPNGPVDLKLVLLRQ